MGLGFIIVLFTVLETVTKEEIWICISNCGV
mgnify:FL=1